MTEYPAVKCPKCRDRYIGAFIGRGQCGSCKTWVDSAPVMVQQSHQDSTIPMAYRPIAKVH